MEGLTEGLVEMDGEAEEVGEDEVDGEAEGDVEVEGEGEGAELVKSVGTPCVGDCDVTEGDADGDTEGASEGEADVEGDADGDAEGVTEGAVEGAEEVNRVGAPWLGAAEGLGSHHQWLFGAEVGRDNQCGCPLAEGLMEGLAEGLLLVKSVGAVPEGLADGLADGVPVRNIDGDCWVGEAEGLALLLHTGRLHVHAQVQDGSSSSNTKGPACAAVEIEETVVSADTALDSAREATKSSCEASNTVREYASIVFISRSN